MVSDEGREVGIEQILEEGVPWDWHEQEHEVENRSPCARIP